MFWLMYHFSKTQAKKSFTGLIDMQQIYRKCSHPVLKKTKQCLYAYIRRNKKKLYKKEQKKLYNDMKEQKKLYNVQNEVAATEINHKPAPVLK